MKRHAKSTFKVVNWDEKTYEEMAEGKKLNKAKVTYTYEGDLVGESLSESLMAYPGENIASFVGLERITGTLGGRSGSFVLQGSGTYDGQVARADNVIVPGSGTGELGGISGTARMEAGHGSTGTLTL